MKSDFPIFKKKIHGNPLVYLDSAATTQKPQCVIDRLVKYYTEENANVHRGVHLLSAETTRRYDASRKKMAQFLNAQSEKEIIFVRGTTEGINLVADVIIGPHLQKGDEILISQLEHHSNILPWQKWCEITGAKLKVIPIFENGDLDGDAFLKMLTDRVKCLAVAHVASAIGTRNPIENMIKAAHQKGIPVLIDGAQAVAREKVDLQNLEADFYVFSGHKIYGPTGIGVLYASEKYLNAAPPYQLGGGMIKTVSWDGATFADLPERFEAGTPNIAGALALAEAIDYVQNIGLDKIRLHEYELLKKMGDCLSAMPGLKVIGQPETRSGVYSFVLDGIHPHDVGTILDQSGIAVRVGHHCSMPLMNFYNLPGTVRASLGIYNDISDIQALEKGLYQVRKIWGLA